MYGTANKQRCSEQDKFPSPQEACRTLTSQLEADPEIKNPANIRFSNNSVMHSPSAYI